MGQGDVSVVPLSLGVIFGFDDGDISHDFETRCGWGLVALFAIPELFGALALA